MFAADAQFDIRPGLTAQVSSDLHQFSNTHEIQASRRITLEFFRDVECVKVFARSVT